MSDGSRYIGDWHYGIRKGFGKLEYSNGDVFQGMWNTEKIDGDGELVCGNGLHYMGTDGLHMLQQITTYRDLRRI